MVKNKNYKIVKYSLIGVSCIIYIILATLLLTKVYVPKSSKLIAVVAIQFAGIFVSLLPLLFEKILKLNYTLYAWGIYLAFCILSMGLGSGFGVYDLVPYYDFFLHLMSGVLIAFLTYATFSKYINKNVSLSAQLFYAFLFAFCFTVVVGVIWEFWEYTFDHLADLNCQRYNDVDGTPFVGHLAVVDTMNDLIADAIGAFITSGALSLFYWIKKEEPKNLFTFKTTTNKISLPPNENLNDSNNNNSNDIKIEKEE